MSTRTTPYYKFPLYDPEASPDLTETGEHDAALNDIDAALHDEAVARKAADDKLTGDLAMETAERKAADAKLTADLAAEKTAREAADGKLTADLAAEIKNRTDADTAIGERIDALDERETADKAGLEQKIKDEASARQEGDQRLTKALDTEKDARVAADTALGKRIDNAEVEISANSADLTGIKGLTYGSDHVQFIENENGSYTSPALDEIDELITKLEKMGWAIIDLTNDKLSSSDYATLQKQYPLVLGMGQNGILAFPYVNTLHDAYTFIALVNSGNHSGEPFSQEAISWRGFTVNRNSQVAAVNEINSIPAKFNPFFSTWSDTYHKPFSKIGTGLKVVSDALQVDTDALPSSGAKTWSELTDKPFEKIGGLLQSSEETGNALTVKYGAGLTQLGGSLCANAGRAINLYNDDIAVTPFIDKSFITDPLNVSAVQAADHGIAYVATGSNDSSAPNFEQLFTCRYDDGKYKAHMLTWNSSTNEYDEHDEVVLGKSTGITGNTTWSDLESALA